MFQDQANTGSSNNSNANNTATIPPKNTLTHVFFHQHQKYPGYLSARYINDDVYSFTGSITIKSDDNGTSPSLEIHPQIFNIGLHPNPNMFRDSNTTTYQITSFFPRGSSPTSPYSPPEGYVPTIITSGSLNISGTLNFCVEHFNISAKNSTLSPFEKVKEINFVTPRISLWSLNIGEDPKLFSLIYDAIDRNKNIIHITFNKDNLEKLDPANYAKLLQLLVERQNLGFNLAENDPTPKLIVPPATLEMNLDINPPSTAWSGSGSMIYNAGGNGGFGGGGRFGTLILSGTNTFTGGLTVSRACGDSDTIASRPRSIGGGGAGYGSALWYGNGGAGGPGNDTSTINNSNSNTTAYPNVGAAVLSVGSGSCAGLSGPGMLQISGAFSGHLSFLDSVKKISFTQSHVNFSSLKLCDSPKFLSLACDTIANDKTVKSIDLSHNDLGNAPAEQLQKLIHMLENHETVTEYDISDNNLSPTLSFSNSSKVKRFQNPALLQENQPSPQRGFVLSCT